MANAEEARGADAPLQPVGSHPAARESQAESTESGAQHVITCSSVLWFVLAVVGVGALSTLVSLAALRALDKGDELSGAWHNKHIHLAVVCIVVLAAQPDARRALIMQV